MTEEAWLNLYNSAAGELYFCGMGVLLGIL